MTSGPEMLLKAALTAFVPKETAERLTATIEGMLKDGSLDGIGSLVSDIQEIKRSQARIEFGLARVFAALTVEQQFYAAREADKLLGNSSDGPVATVAQSDGPLTIAGPGNGGDAGGEPDGVCGRDVGKLSRSINGHDRTSGTLREIGTRACEGDA